MTNLEFIVAMGTLAVLALILYIRHKKEDHDSPCNNNELEYDNDEYDYGHNVNHDETTIF